MSYGSAASGGIVPWNGRPLWAAVLIFHSQSRIIMLETILIVLLVLMLLGSVPSWPHSRSWGYFPSGGLGLVLLILVILVLLDKVHLW